MKKWILISRITINATGINEAREKLNQALTYLYDPYRDEDPETIPQEEIRQLSYDVDPENWTIYEDRRNNERRRKETR